MESTGDHWAQRGCPQGNLEPLVPRKRSRRRRRVQGGEVHIIELRRLPAGLHDGLQSSWSRLQHQHTQRCGLAIWQDT